MEAHEWTRRGPGRFLLWWPFFAFALVALFPGAGILPIVASGAGLSLLGVAAAGVARLARRSTPESESAVPERVA
jgi:hypothetical protein